MSIFSRQFMINSLLCTSSAAPTCAILSATSSSRGVDCSVLFRLGLVWRMIFISFVFYLNVNVLSIHIFRLYSGIWKYQMNKNNNNDTQNEWISEFLFFYIPTIRRYLGTRFNSDVLVKCYFYLWRLI